MKFISHAQNFEDVILWRALKHIDKGCYVDIGAQHPTIDSVSKGFYQRGWRGIHFEPVPYYADLLRKDRPDEQIMQIALSDTDDFIELNVFPDTGLSTAIDKYAAEHVQRGFRSQKLKVKTLPLSKALQFLIGKDIHWLKIDVEGFETSVLKGWDSATLRPWVMVVEATVPMSQEPDYLSWEPIIIAAGYKFVYFDGLNRFYVANEHKELLPAFLLPPNLFDGFILSATNHFSPHLVIERSLYNKYRKIKQFGFFKWINRQIKKICNFK